MPREDARETLGNDFCLGGGTEPPTSVGVVVDGYDVRLAFGSVTADGWPRTGGKIEECCARDRLRRVDRMSNRSLAAAITAQQSTTDLR